MYIEHVATAPGNIPTPLWGRRLLGIGSALMAYSVMTSAQDGFEGRIGLHAADIEAERFYEKLNERCGNHLFTYRAVGGVPGPIRPGQQNVPNLQDVYLEADGPGALELLEGYRRE